ncbi:hypothetical protein JW935_28355 [candidate division KSB1 bacterium]|nr:hypothetical protein [candidate division KSB1 bacterium]
MPSYGKIFFPTEVILVFIHEKPAFFARIESVVPDVKKGWWKMTFLILTIPLQTMTWILDDDQMRGASYTMGGNPVRIERIESPQEPPKQADKTGPGKIVSMFDEP